MRDILRVKFKACYSKRRCLGGALFDTKTWSAIELYNARTHEGNIAPVGFELSQDREFKPHWR